VPPQVDASDHAALQRLNGGQAELRAKRRRILPSRLNKKSRVRRTRKHGAAGSRRGSRRRTAHQGKCITRSPQRSPIHAQHNFADFRSSPPGGAGEWKLAVPVRSRPGPRPRRRTVNIAVKNSIANSNSSARRLKVSLSGPLGSSGLWMQKSLKAASANQVRHPLEEVANSRSAQISNTRAAPLRGTGGWKIAVPMRSRPDQRPQRRTQHKGLELQHPLGTRSSQHKGLGLQHPLGTRIWPPPPARQRSSGEAAAAEAVA
jgi:hypothetical protein